MAISVLDVGNRKTSRGGTSSSFNGENARSEDNTIIFPNKRLLFVDDSVELYKGDLADKI